VNLLFPVTARLTLLLSVFVSITADAMAQEAAPPLSIASFVAKAEAREPLSVVFFGGSLTYGANASDPLTTSYRGRMTRWLQEQYPHTPITFHDAAIGGSGSNLGLFRLERDVLAHKPDLVFLDFTVNDDAEGVDVRALAAYERIVRELLQARVRVLPVLMLFKSHASNPDAPLPPRHEAHLKLAAAYQLPAANVLAYIRAKARSGTSPDDLWNLGDGAHPGDEGYQLFFEAVRDRFVLAGREKAPMILPAALVFDDLYPRHTRKVLTDSLPSGWTKQKTYRTALWFDGMASRWMGDVATAAAASNPAPLEVEFEGSMVGIFGERNGLAPPIKVWIDGKPIQAPKAKPDDFLWKIDTSRFAPAKKGSGNLFLWQLLANNLSDGKHTLRIEPVFTGADKDAELRIESVCSAGR